MKKRPAPTPAGGSSGKSARSWALLAGVFLVVAAILGGIIWAIAALVGGPQEPLSGPLVTAPSTSAAASSSAAATAGAPGGVLDCPVINQEGKLQGADAGDPNTSKGVIMAYEHAFFVRRDPAAMVAMTRPGPYVADESTLAKGLEDLPEDTAWCVTIMPSATVGTFDVTLRYQPKGGEIVTWRQDMSVAGDGPFYITSVR